MDLGLGNSTAHSGSPIRTPQSLFPNLSSPNLTSPIRNHPITVKPHISITVKPTIYGIETGGKRTSKPVRQTEDFECRAALAARKPKKSVPRIMPLVPPTRQVRRPGPPVPKFLSCVSLV
jgi:hypothetical protein